MQQSKQNPNQQSKQHKQIKNHNKQSETAPYNKQLYPEPYMQTTLL